MVEDRGAEPRKDVNVRTAQLVQLLTELGPDIPEISRRLGQFKESVRYRYKEKILNKGLAVQAMPDHEKLGLSRVMLLLDFAEPYREHAPAILTAMSDLCYVVSFAKTLPLGQYSVAASVPTEFVGEFIAMFSQLKEMGLFTSVETFEFEWFRNAPMKAEFYDFDSGRWDFDWSERGSTDYQSANYSPSSPSRFDQVDLLIIKELQKDANKSLKEISDELGLNYKKLAWHYNTHVVGKRLLRGYRVIWMGTRYDYRIEKALHRQHRYLMIEFLVRNVSNYEMMALRQKVNHLPFLWGEAAGKNYAAEFAFPVDHVVESLQYLEEALAGVRDRTQVLTVDQTNAIGFSIAYRLFDTKSRTWTFSRPELVSKFENLLLQIKETR
ncbi:MAG: winged helix-turn-helix transcriptional regulator [Nitrososphaerales archaeon]|nr:winged helix-turn-helix transcriptional regulator [Nitrososphaerales archaeon]